MLNRQDARVAETRGPGSIEMLNRQDAKVAETRGPGSIEMLNRQDAKVAKTREPDEKVDELAHAVIEGAIEVHRVLGPGYLESVDEEALCLELRSRGIQFVRQPAFAVDYKGRKVGESQLDLLVGGVLIVELKAVERLMPIHSAEVISYLKATGHHLGLLINFNVGVLRDGIRRVVLS